MSVIAAYRLVRDGIDVEGVATYGAPRPGNVPFKEAYNAMGLGERTHRWMNYRDIGPRIPTWKPHLPFTDGSLAPRHVGGLHLINDDQTASLYFEGLVVETSYTGGSFHSTNAYCQLIRDNMEFWLDAPGTGFFYMPPAP